MPIQFRCANPKCGFELVISARADVQEVRCSNCGLLQPVPDSELPPPAPRDAPPQPPRRRTPLSVVEPAAKEYGLLGDGLRSILYALRALPRMLAVILALLGARVLYDLYFSPISILRIFCLFRVLLPVLMGIWWYAMIGFALRYFLDVSLASLEGSRRTPGIPRLGLWGFFEYGINGLGLLVLYVLPVVTLPLLPLGLLAHAWSEDLRPFDLRWALRAAWRFRRALARLWAILLFWSVALGAAAWGISWATGLWIGGLLSGGEGLGTELLASLIDVLGALALSLIGCLFLCVLFRCAGLAGRYHPEILDSLPEKPPRIPVLAGMMAAGAAATLLVHYGIHTLLSP